MLYHRVYTQSTCHQISSTLNNLNTLRIQWHYIWQCIYETFRSQPPKIELNHILNKIQHFVPPALYLSPNSVSIHMMLPYSQFHIHMLSLCVNRARFMQNDWVNIQKKRKRASKQANERKKRAGELTSTSAWNRNAWHIELIKFYLFRTSTDQNCSWLVFFSSRLLVFGK